MLLTVDIGNTNTVFGLFRGKRLYKERRMATDVYAASRTDAGRMKRLLPAKIFRKNKVTGIIIASVVPGVTARIRRVLTQLFNVPCMLLGPVTRTGIRVQIKKPRELGPDRLANAVAAHALRKEASIVVDFGTATTFDCIAPAGRYIGGVIVPGPELAARSLFQGTALLPYVHAIKVRSVIGKSTIECIRSGLFFGYCGLIERVLREVKKSMHWPVKVFATGGHARFWSVEIAGIHAVKPHLTLDGLRIIWEMNHEK